LPEALPPLLLDSITKADAATRGRVVVTGSHGGVYAAAAALAAGCRAAVFHDAGVGRDGAGIGGLAWLDGHGMAAAAVDHRSAAIGQAAEMLAQGVIAHVNAAATACGVRPGMACAAAAAALAAAPLPTAPPVAVGGGESRVVLTPPGARRRLVLVDSAALVRPEDAGQVVVTGSHGALFGSDLANALKADAALALFNDAGGGPGCGRLPPLAARGVAAATVAAASARIGLARSTWEEGVISAVNTPAAALGARPGMAAAVLVRLALEA
jgi:hypothetical protein